MNNKRKSYTFFIKEKYIIFAADETKAAKDKKIEKVKE